MLSIAQVHVDGPLESRADVGRRELDGDHRHLVGDDLNAVRRHAWRRGDEATLAKLLAEGFEEYPDLYRPLTTDRNRRWVPKIEALLDDRDDYLIVVGTLHLVGRDSVLELLKKQGYRVRQH